MPPPLSLCQLTNDIIKTYSPLAARRKTYFVNIIPAELYTNADPELISSVLAGLFSAIVNHSPECCIQLSAKNYKSGIVLLHIRNCNMTESPVMEEELRGLQKLAEKIGGFVGKAGQRKHLTTLAFSFRRLQAAA